MKTRLAPRHRLSPLCLIALATLHVFLGCSPATSPQGSEKTPKPVVSILSQTRAQTKGDSRVRIGAFNIQMFGQAKLGRPRVLALLAKIATTYDLLAIEEVGSNSSTASEASSTTVMETYVARINALAGEGAYAYCRGDQFGIVYKKAAFDLLSFAPYSGGQTFTYRPLTAYFKSTEGTLDFALLVIHTSPSKAEVEIPELKKALAEVAAYYSEPDVIALGDFNADGSYYAEGEGAALAGFDPAAYITGIPNGADTTTAASSKTYDRIEMSASMQSDYDGSWGVVDLSKDYAADLVACEGSPNTAGTASAVSDHYPVWIEAYVDRDGD